MAEDVCGPRTHVGEADRAPGRLGVDCGRDLFAHLPDDCRVVPAPHPGVRGRFGKEAGQFVLHGHPAVRPVRAADIPAGCIGRRRRGYPFYVLRDGGGFPVWKSGGISLCRDAIG